MSVCPREPEIPVQDHNLVWSSVVGAFTPRGFGFIVPETLKPASLAPKTTPRIKSHFIFDKLSSDSTPLTFLLFPCCFSFSCPSYTFQDFDSVTRWKKTNPDMLLNHFDLMIWAHDRCREHVKSRHYRSSHSSTCWITDTARIPLRGGGLDTFWVWVWHLWFIAFQTDNLALNSPRSKCDLRPGSNAFTPLAGIPAVMSRSLCVLPRFIKRWTPEGFVFLISRLRGFENNYSGDCAWLQFCECTSEKHHSF